MLLAPSSGRGEAVRPDMERVAQKEAVRSLRKPTLEDVLRRWWEGKFSLPWSDERAQSLTLFELTKLYWEDVYKNDSKALMEASKNERGEIVFEETGDPMIDKWEKEISLGVVPDLTEGLSRAELGAMEREQAAVARARAGMAALADHDTG